MSSRPIIIEGISYVRSRDAAHEVGLCRDYASALARSGLIAGQRVAGTWFVNLASLCAFMVEQQRQKELWRARMAQMRREEQRLASLPKSVMHHASNLRDFHLQNPC